MVAICFDFKWSGPFENRTNKMAVSIDHFYTQRKITYKMVSASHYFIDSHFFQLWMIRSIQIPNKIQTSKGSVLGWRSVFWVRFSSTTVFDLLLVYRTKSPGCISLNRKIWFWNWLTHQHTFHNPLKADLVGCEVEWFQSFQIFRYSSTPHKVSHGASQLEKK